MSSSPPPGAPEEPEAAPAAPAAARAEPVSLETLVDELRRLALLALDGGHPMAAAQIASTADRLQAEVWPDRPQRPDYVRRRYRG